MPFFENLKSFFQSQSVMCVHCLRVILWKCPNIYIFCLKSMLDVSKTENSGEILIFKNLVAKL